ncbi:hypothetical protein BDW02DRAFT_570352 [Decorospora gaudefroyi]|uniref:Uncharacterized protein n=1 Tax=Decorospora gaudefroyi TaxID=184978 RepID=A0A6A5K5Z2_9PLEO|nr:hypothetical protein BDW02DRAFT_570352 [Decorospora gaudefroyi]
MAAPDWISAVSGLVAAVITLITLFTVYVAALQLLSERRKYRHSLSHMALGPWRPKVLSSSLFGFRTSVSTPFVSLAKLMELKWSPQLEFPLGIPNQIPRKRLYFRDIEKADETKILAQSSWVTFMQGLGISPTDTTRFDMRFESSLLAGCVPMRWRGPDLVGLCAMLGFVSHEATPSFSSPMPLPLQWTGPLGWMQFRDGSQGCVAEFRRRNDMTDQLSKEASQYFQNQAAGTSCSLIPRLCHALGGLCITVDGQDRLFYVGPQDFERTIHFFLEAWKKSAEEDQDKSKDEDAKSENSSATNDNEHENDSDSSFSSEASSTRELFDDIEKKSMPDEEILEKLWGVQHVDLKRRGLGVKKGELRGDLLKSAPDEMRKKQRKERGLKEILIPCPGLLSVVIQGEMATTYGLDISSCVEYHRIFSLDDNLTGRDYPYHLGNMYMDRDTLKLFKNALLRFKPDGFYLCPTGVLNADINDVYTHVKGGLFGTEQIFPDIALADWNDNDDLYWAVKLCKEMQVKRRKARATFSIKDMTIISRASERLQRHPSSPDLFWALLVCPALFTDLRTRLGSLDATTLKLLLVSDLRIEKEVLVCPELADVAKESNENVKDDADSDVDAVVTGRTGDGGVDYVVPECLDGAFTGARLVAAFLDVCLTFYWIEKMWLSDVCMYTAAIPSTVMML